MDWTRPPDLTDEYDPWMKGRPTQVWALLEAANRGDARQVGELLRQEGGLARADFGGFTALDFASREDRPEIVKLLLEAGADPSRRPGWAPSPLEKAGDRGFTAVVALMEAAVQARFQSSGEGRTICDATRGGDVGKVIALLEAHPDWVDAGDPAGNRPLHIAVARHDVSTIHALLDRGADPNIERSDGSRPIHLAMGWRGFYRDRLSSDHVHADTDRLFEWYLGMQKDAVIVGILLSRGADYDVSVAACVGDLVRVRARVESDPSLANAANSASHRPLSFAARQGHTAILRYLLEHGADPNAPQHDAPKGAALHWAAGNNHVLCARLLLEHGADGRATVYAAGPAWGSARTPEMKALFTEFGYTEVNDPPFDWTDLDAVDRRIAGHPETATGALGIAVEEGWVELLERLLQHGADLNAPCFGSNYMTWRGFECFTRPDPTGILHVLFRNGADPTLSIWPGVTYLHKQCQPPTYEASKNCKRELIGVLLDHGADIDALDEEWLSTPLGWAARCGLVEIARYLLQRGADPNLAGKAWATPLAWAERKGHVHVRNLLREHGATA